MKANVENENENYDLTMLPGFKIGEKVKETWKTSMKACILISEEYGKRIIGNLINENAHCNACLTKCIGRKCKYGKYNFTNISVIKIPEAQKLPEIIENPEKIIRKIPKAEIAIATRLHNDIYLALPKILQKSGIKALLILRSHPKDAPPGVSREVEEKCRELGIEFDNPKPPCLLEPNKDKPIISKFIREYRIGKPILKIETNGKISKVEVKISTPCGSTWYIARMLLNHELKRGDEKSIDKLCEYIALLNQSFCTASTAYDYELGDTIMHWATYIGIESILKALNLKEKFNEIKRKRIRRKII